jgi:hypothetical protein
LSQTLDTFRLLFLSQPGRNLDDYFLPNVVRLIVMAEYFPSLFQLFVNDVEGAREATRHIGTDKFQVKSFEDKYGIALVGIYPQLSIMRELFNVQPQSDNSKPSLQRQAYDVYALTRLV